jgi:pyrroloquinoline-quinone synthase
LIQKAEITNTLTRLVNELIDRSPFFLFWKTGKVDAETSHRFLVSFDSLVKSFPALIAQGAARMEDEESRVVLAVNLFQESGEGDITRTHHAIYRKFLSSAGIDTSALSENSFAVEWRNRLSAYLQNADIGSALGALASGEFLAQPALSRIYPVLQSHYPQADQEYFTKHLDLEVEHVEEITTIIARNTETDEDWKQVVEGFKFGLSVWETYFNQLAKHLKPKTAFATDKHG